MNTPDTELKKWFEANYLDGDEVQEGQMLASSECLDALLSRDTYWKERVRKEVEKMKKKSVCRNPAHGKESHTCENTIRNKVITDIVEFITRDKTNGL